MTDGLSTEELPLSQREPLTRYYVANTLGANTHVADLVNRFSVEQALYTGDVAILDLDLPNISQSNMIAYLKRAGLNIPIIEVFTGRVTGPVRSLIALFERWGISDFHAAELLGQQSRSFIGDLRAGSVGLDTRDLQDRARLILGIYEGVHSLLQDADAERSWINAKLEALENSSILDIMLRGSISDLTYAKSYVDYVNGR
jgi:hypothetical protein